MALSAIHNLIHTHEPGEEALLESPNIFTNDEAPAAGTVEQEADVQHDNIVKQMWDDYLCLCEEQSINTNDSGDSGDNGKDDEEHICLDKSNDDWPAITVGKLQITMVYSPWKIAQVEDWENIT